ncbi:GAF domain-containing protein [Candidatus Woesearchaeota archaeon]|nr:GAF domain-containing protein [Candidatus Woesearchaeota archaeon]
MSTDKVIKFEDSEQYAQITTAIERITKALEADRSTLFLYDKKIDKLVAHVAEGHDGKTIQVDVGQGIAGTAFKMGTVINVEDAYNSSYFEKKHDEGTGYKTKSVIAIPLLSKLHGKPIGVIQALNKHTGRFTPEDEEILEMFASVITMVIEMNIPV